MGNQAENKVLKFITSNKLLERGDKVLLALSGGPDSVFAFHFLSEHAEQLGITFAALHLNHCIRGTESDEDEQFCKDLCSEFNVDLYSFSSDIPELSGNSKKSLEEVARNERYKLLEDCSEKEGFTKIVTAHNSNDNTETVLLNLSKGCGISGLRGIPVQRGNIIRPLLCISKEEILDYLAHKRIEYRLDSSNKDSKYERNFLRNEIIPALKNKINPRLDDAVFNSSRIINRFYKLVENEIKNLYAKYISVDSGNVSIHLELFEEDEFIQGELLKELFKTVLEIEFNQASFSTLTELYNNQVGRKNNLASNFKAVRERESIEIFQIKETNNKEIELTINESAEFEGYELKIEEVNRTGLEITKDRNLEFISADNLDDIFILRKWKSGDVFSPLGLNGQKNVSDFLTDEKVSNKSRKDVYVLTNRNKIVWVVGLRLSDNFKVTKTTKRIFKLCLKQKTN